MERIASFSPDVLLVERGVARFAQELLLEKGIALVLNVKVSTLDRLARCTGGQVHSSAGLATAGPLPLAATLLSMVLPCTQTQRFD